MFHRLTRCLLLLSGALAAGAPAHAGARWEALSSGLNEIEVFGILGTPLIVHEGRGYRQWTFDAGGLVMFHHGAVAFWGTPRGHRPAAPPARPTVIAEPLPDPVTLPPAPAVAVLTAPDPAPDRPVFTKPAPTDTTTPKVEVRVPSFAEITRS